MSIVVLKLPDVKRSTEARPKECPYCDGETFQRWGRVKKRVRDTQARSIWVYRYRCCRWKDVSALSGRDDESRSDRAAAAVCSDLLEIGIELLWGKHDPEWFEDHAMFDDRLAGCTGAGGKAQAAKRVEAGAGAGIGRSLRAGLGREATGAGGGGSGSRTTGGSRVYRRA